MGMAAEKLKMNPLDYLAFERESEEKHEFVDGELFNMSGASHKHNLISGNTFASLHGQLKKSPCEIYSNDMRVNINALGNYVYPDIIVTCEKPKFIDTHLDTLLNPLLVVEVLSPSTEAYDRGKKFLNYRHLDSLQAYVLIAQDEARVEYYRRGTAKEWVLTEVSGLEAVLNLTLIDCQLALADVYDKVNWDVENNEANTHA